MPTVKVLSTLQVNGRTHHAGDITELGDDIITALPEGTVELVEEPEPAKDETKAEAAKDEAEAIHETLKEAAVAPAGTPAPHETSHETPPAAHE